MSKTSNSGALPRSSIAMSPPSLHSRGRCFRCSSYFDGPAHDGECPTNNVQPTRASPPARIARWRLELVVISELWNPGSEPGAIAAAANQKHRAEAIRRRRIQHVVDSKIAVRFERNASGRGAALDKGRCGFTDQRREDALVGILTDAVAAAKEQAATSDLEARSYREAMPSRVFEEVVLPHLDAAFNYARWLTKSDADAEDVVQDAAVRALRFFSSLRNDDARAWLL